ncbi:MAG TPA: PucR family transcriptional regulator ligand-binding domain-containing protein [Dermatophilaceae bacterium]|nr:PucR family transcriptional regulator ligand-binding domain-containing protein [Dermatophilaceae bacterium]
MQERPSSCTVADLLAAPDLGLGLATPAADLTRPVRWVQTTELVDPTQYLRPDELVCTVGTSLLDDRAVHTFVEAVAGRAAALCFGLGDVHERPPKGLAEACRRLGLPLLTLPYGVAFLAVADVVEKLRGQASQAESLGRLVDLIQSGMARPESLRDALAAHGLDPNRLVVAAWPSGSAALLTGRLDGGAVAETGEQTVTISASLSPVLAVARSTQLRCGYADPVTLADLGSALSTAQLALAAAPAGGGPCGPDDVASFSLLLESIPREKLRPFLIRVIEPLVAAGGHASPTYLDTLRAFLDHDLSVGQTAKAQFLHPNTVRHRLALIKELTGKDPFVTEGVLALAVAVRAHERDRRSQIAE